MIKIGRYNNLKISRVVDMGLFLTDSENSEVLLPNKYCPIDYKVGDEINVFIHLDRSDRVVATNLSPKIKLYEFGFLRVESVTDAGAFLDWGMDKHLYLPKSESRDGVEVGQWHIVYMLQDDKTEKLYASRKVERYLQNDDLTVKEGEEVDLLIYQDAGFGLSVIINNQHKGMVYNNENFKPLSIGDRVKGWIKTVRDDNKLDVSLQPIGYKNYIDPNNKLILEEIERHGGFIQLNDKSKPEEIYETFGISKKLFKKSVGSLLKNRQIILEDNGIKTV
ncbi:GntR family transcriptional regulator [Thiospirochaeta perfilievii]|uniref:GntR family transcriptional regulator n=1 Tax=Thiospirochaeta perfilievii TaxID=252967 RepID=A0A5C1Q7G9_9SPIO|nr:S1-like domain-containing RNA-binding protein [Thiospirochaeta perfilievii]QEN03975.1 GntR family transcriptional regulator [Thiospirochaeta perfilievii]